MIFAELPKEQQQKHIETELRKLLFIANAYGYVVEVEWKRQSPLEQPAQVSSVRLGRGNY